MYICVIIAIRVLRWGNFDMRPLCSDTEGTGCTADDEDEFEDGEMLCYDMTCVMHGSSPSTYDYSEPGCCFI